MSNNIANKLVVNAKSVEEIEKFLETIKGETEDNILHIDFNKIIPIPEELIDTEESTKTANSLYYYLTKTNKEGIIPKVIGHPQFYNMSRFDNCTPEELEEYMTTGEKYFNLYLKYGHITWYDWRIANWGTKWNAYDTYIDDCGDKYAIIFFYTAWSGVPEIIYKLVEMFPNLSFEYVYADEDVSYNCGEGRKNEDGVFIINRAKEGSDEAMALYIEAWQEDWSNFKKTDNGWEYDWGEDDE